MQFKNKNFNMGKEVRMYTSFSDASDAGCRVCSLVIFLLYGVNSGVLSWETFGWDAMYKHRGSLTSKIRCNMCNVLFHLVGWSRKKDSVGWPKISCFFFSSSFPNCELLKWEATDCTLPMMSTSFFCAQIGFFNWFNRRFWNKSMLAHSCSDGRRRAGRCMRVPAWLMTRMHYMALS